MPRRPAGSSRSASRASRDRGVSYDVALGLEALARIERVLGHPGADEHDREAAAIFAQLGVVATPTVPLPGG